MKIRLHGLGFNQSVDHFVDVEAFTHLDEARRLLQALYATEVNLLPDPASRTLTVRLHHLANASSDAAIEKLCEELNATETIFPRTNLRLVFKLGSS